MGEHSYVKVRTTDSQRSSGQYFWNIDILNPSLLRIEFKQEGWADLTTSFRGNELSSSYRTYDFGLNGKFFLLNSQLALNTMYYIYEKVCPVIVENTRVLLGAPAKL